MRAEGRKMRQRAGMGKGCAGGHVRIGQSQFSGAGGAQCFASRKANDADLS